MSGLKHRSTSIIVNLPIDVKSVENDRSKRYICATDTIFTLTTQGTVY